MFSSSTTSGSPLRSVSLLNASTRRSLHNTSSLANRSLSVRTEQALKETANHVVKALNSPVPVQVQEVLRGDLSVVSVKLHVSGWAWLVCENLNRVLVWRYAPVETAVARCFQLDLPSPFHSGGWNADLITICGQISSNCIGLLAASLDGHLHYWDNILRERSSPSVNGTVDVGTDHVMVAAPILGSSGVVLFTSEGSLFLTHLPTQSQPTLSARLLNVSQGLLSGFSRRVSSLFFGSSDAGQRAEGRGLAIRETEDGCSDVFVLMNTSLLLLQKWTIEPTREQMVYEVSLEPLIAASVIQRDWFKGQQVSLTVWSVDITLAQDCAVVLFAVRLEGSGVAEYGLALFDANHNVAPLSPDGLVQLNHKKAYESGREASLCSLTLHSAPSSPSLTVHDRNTLLLSIAVAEDAVTDVVNFPSSTAILGTGHLEDSVVLFTTAHGVISVHLTSSLHSLHPPSPPPSSITQSSTRVNSSLLVTPTVFQRHSVALPPEAVIEAVEKLKNAFLEYLEGNISEASVSAHQLFSTDPYSEQDAECVGDVAVKTLSEMILNDQPAQDPRWGDSRESLTGGSLIIIYQLENKQTAHLRLLQFLTDCSLLKKLSCVTERGQLMRTAHLLCEHAEKIAAAIALRKAHNQVVDQGIKVCVLQWSPAPALRPGLSHQDLFYTEVSRLGDIFPSLVSLLESRLQSLSHPKERLQLVLGACSAVESMVREALQYRQTKVSLYSPPLPLDPASLPPFLPWTASGGSSGARRSLSQLVEFLYDVATRDAESQLEQAEVWRVAVGLCDALLGGYLDQIHSMEHNPSLTTELAQVRKRFESTRERYLSPLLDHGQYDQGIELAERYHDFHLLVQLCGRAGDRERLKSYVVRFAEQGFAEFLFKQHLDRGQLQELLSYSEDFPQQLTEFLKPHDQISWLHHLATQDYSMAHTTLHRLAQKEEVYLAKKKTQLSLSKLALLASGSENGNGDMKELNRQLNVIEYQRNIPASVVEALGVDVEIMAPLPPADIVQLYVGDKNTSAEETDFLCALELLQVAFEDTKSEEFCELRTYIWSQAALRDNWSQMSTDDPLEQLPHTLLFRIIQAAYHKEFDLSDLLPTVEDLLASPSLLDTGVSQDTQFRFLVSAGFEQLKRVQCSVKT